MENYDKSQLHSAESPNAIDFVKADFNKISELIEPKWNHNNCYFKHLLKFVPDNADICLDIGCGKGELSFLLSEKAKKVIAVDIAEKMIEKAKELHAKDNVLEKTRRTRYIYDNERS